MRGLGGTSSFASFVVLARNAFAPDPFIERATALKIFSDEGF
jgi:hypothetical protein